MAVKNIQSIFSLLLCVINLLIIQPSFVSCEEIEIKIFGIKVKSDEVGEVTKGKQVGYIVLNYVLSGLCALAIALVVLFFCCIFICCTNKKRGNDEERAVHDQEEEEEDDDVEDETTEEKPKDEGNKDEGNKDEGEEKRN